MTLKKRKTYELEIIDLAFGGRGIAKPGGFPVFVDRGLPGDVVVAKVIKKKKSFAEAKLVKFLEKSSLRRNALCRYSGYCGGCKWQELPYGVQLEYKKNHVMESLQHIGGFHDVPVRDTIPSEKVFGFRNKMEFSCSESRWLMPDELDDPDAVKGFGIGLHAPGTFDRVIDIEQCLIQPEKGNEILAHVRGFIQNSGAPVYGLRSHEGFWRFLMLRHSTAFDKWMVNIVTSQEDAALLKGLAGELTERFGEIGSVVNNITSKKAGIAVGEYEKVLAGNRCIIEKLGPYTFEISANSFFQTNTRAAETLYSIVADYAGLTGTERVVDLYSGTGTIPLWLSGQAKSVLGIEIVESAVKDAWNNARINGVENVDFVTGDIMDVLPGIDGKVDVMVIDPPRAGMHKNVVSGVLKTLPGRIVYVSCNPSTLARDLEMLSSRYKISEVTPVDMFPHTFHIESVAWLEKR
ncbi:MAG: 23S rRNA (uracil(1939)-C(5))-methyltransferase RlmD [Desulfobacteraceae bacterium]